MIETAFAQLRFAASMLFGWRFSPRAFDALIDAALATRHEFGRLGAEGGELIQGPALDDETRRDLQLRRFRQQAARAAHQTPYYTEVFRQLGISDPAHLTWEGIQSLPRTPKEALRDHPDRFLCQDARPVFHTATTGTTGWPTSVCFSAYEMQTFIALNALGLLFEGHITNADIALLATSARATLGNTCGAGGLARIGALVFLGGLVDPALTLALLAERHTIPGKRERISYLTTYPSYLGELVETGLRLGYTPADFRLRVISVGGEIVTAGLLARARRLFGDDFAYESGYGMTEPWPCTGRLCPEGHLHFEPSQGLVEVYNPDTQAPAQPGEYGTLVITPFAPYRETTLLLRYDTQDVVRVLDPPVTCRLRALPAVSNIQGKLPLAVRHDGGWTYPRAVMEALEAVDLTEEVPLPARFGYWAAPGGVAVNAVIRDGAEATSGQRKIARALLDAGVPLRELHLLPERERAQLRQPFPLRGDLRETSFRPTWSRVLPPGAEGGANRPAPPEPPTPHETALLPRGR